MKKTVEPQAVVVESRGESFAARVKTKICREVPDGENPFVAQRVLWHGYDVLELMRNRSLVDVVFLLLKGELPEQSQARQLEQILIALANPGPRHTSTRAVMNASVSKSEPLHWLPIGLALLGGEHNGAAAVRDSIRFFRKNRAKPPEELAAKIVSATSAPTEGDIFPVPGFGSLYASIDRHALAVAEHLAASFPENAVLAWGMRFGQALHELPAGWLMTGVAAAVLTDLGFTPNAGAGLFQLAACPGLLAHGIELSGKPLTSMPFVSDENYIYEELKIGE